MEVHWKRELTSQYSLVKRAATPSPLVNQRGSHALPGVTSPAETLPARPSGKLTRSGTISSLSGKLSYPIDPVIRGSQELGQRSEPLGRVVPSSAYLLSKMQCAAPVSTFAIRSTDWLPWLSVTGASIPTRVER
jgi:hypothetical protein